jgi:alpha-1,6-mannosyltransferase
MGRMRAMVAAWSAGLVITPPLFSRDLMSYAAQANLLRTGHNPYEVGPWVEPGQFADSVDPLWAATPAPYGPVFLALGRGVSEVTGDSVFLTVLGMRLLAVAGVALLVIYLPRLASRCGVDARAAMWLGLLNPLTFMHFVSGGHNDALMIGLVVMGLCLALEGHPALGSAMIALAAGVKAPAALTLAFVGHIWANQLQGRSRTLRGLAAAGVTAVATFAVVTALTGVGYGWIAALGTPATVRTWLSPPTAVGMLSGLVGRALDLGNHTYELVDQARLVSGAVAVLLIAVLALRPRGIHPVRAAALALFLIVVLGPVVQPWYLMWALIVVAAAGVRAREANLVTWGVIAVVLISQLNGSTMVGALAVPGTIACVALTAAIVTRARAAERARHGEESVFDLAAVRPAEPHPQRHEHHHVGTMPAFARALT